MTDEARKPDEPAALPETGDASFRQAAASAAAALFGVQSSKNRHQDFQSRSPAKFIFMGAVMVCLFVTCVLFAVRCSMQAAAQ